MSHPLAALVPVRMEARAQAHAFCLAHARPEWERRTAAKPRPMPETWGAHESAVNELVPVFLALLCDLSREDSRLTLARLIAQARATTEQPVGTVPYLHAAYMFDSGDDPPTSYTVAHDGVRYELDLPSDYDGGFDDAKALESLAVRVLAVLA